MTHPPKLPRNPSFCHKPCNYFIPHKLPLLFTNTTNKAPQLAHLPSMSILHHQTYPIKTFRHSNGNHHGFVSVRIRCTSTAPPPPKLGVKQPIKQSQMASVSPLLAENVKAPKPGDPSLKSTWSHRVWLASGCTTLVVSLAKSVTGAVGSHVLLEPALAGLVGYFLADLGSGIYHWGIDNYGDASTPFFGGQIDAFQGHHRWPWTITKREFANNLHALARAVGFSVLPLDLVCNDPTVHAFVGVFAGCIMFSQQFHAWSHGTKSKLPGIVVALQDVGILVSRSEHGAHHRPPYNNNYCIVSGVWNKFLDENKVFEAMEMILFFQLGIRPRSWSEPSLEWTEDATLLPSPSE